MLDCICPVKSWIFCFPDTTELFIKKTLIINLATVGLLAVISGFSTLNIPANIDGVEAYQGGETNKVETVVEERALTAEERVKDYFSDIPILVDIAECESRFRHTGKSGNIIRGEINSYDMGVMQINEWYHGKTAKNLGINLYSIEGNMAYARYLYEKEGTTPWNSSSRCWAPYSEIARR